MSRVLIVDAERRPLMPCTPARARLLPKAGKVTILRRFLFVLMLHEARPEAVVEPLRVKLDPGSKTSGIAVLHEQSGEVMWAAELTHRSPQIREALAKRRAVRQSRRSRHTRYRAARFANRRRPTGWLAPSLESRVLHLLTWVKRLSRWCPVGALSLELVRFDLALLQNPSIEGSNTNAEPCGERKCASICSPNGSIDARIARRARCHWKSTMCLPVRKVDRIASQISPSRVGPATKPKVITPLSHFWQTGQMCSLACRRSVAPHCMMQRRSIARDGSCMSASRPLICRSRRGLAV